MHGRIERIGGRYRIGEELGRGGMGAVYAAHDEAEGRDVAVKCMTEKVVDNTSARLLFREEFRRLSQIEHPNFPAAYDVGGLADGATPYFAMELIRGQRIDQLGRVELDTFYSILTQLLQALSFLHARGYIHGDVKPSNLILTEDGVLKLMDLGLLTPVGSVSDGEIRGTPGYIAPEVVRGEVMREPVDLYAVGVTSYHLLSGTRPFKGTGSSLVEAQLTEQPTPLEVLRPDLPEALTGIVHRLLATNPRERYQDTTQVGRDLATLVGREVTLERAAQTIGDLATSRLVGRDREWAVLRSALDDLKRGSGGAYFVDAAAGVGKSRLLKEARLEAKLAGYQVISAEAPEALSDPLALVGDLVGASLVGRDDAELTPFAAALATLHPRMRGLARSAASSPSPEDLAEGLAAWFRHRAQQRPLVAVVDDLHWADLRSLDLLNRTIRRLQNDPVLVLGAFRRDEVDPSHAVMHTIDEGLTQRIGIEPFSRDEVGELLSLMLPGDATLPDSLVDGVFRITAGNAFFVDELLRHFIDEDFLSRKEGKFTVAVDFENVRVPSGLTGTVASRLAHVSDKAKRLVEAGAVLGQGFPLSLWHDVSGLESDSFIEALHELERRHFVRRADGALHFLHESARQVVLDQIDRDRAHDLYEQAGQCLETGLESSRDLWLPRVAVCFARGRDREKGVRYSLEAGEHAIEKNAEGEAFIHFKRAASILESLPPSRDNDARLLTVYERIAQLSSAVWADAPTCLRWFRRAVELNRAKGDTEKVFGLSLSWAITNTIAGRYADARRILADLSGQVEPNTVPWAVLYGVGVCLTDWYEGRYQDCFRNAEESIRIFENALTEASPDSDYPPYSWALFWRDKARSYMSVPIDRACIEKIRHMSEHGRSDAVILWHTMTAVGARAGFTGRLDDLLEWKTWAEDASRRLGKLYWFECWVSHSYVYGMLGAFKLEGLGVHVARLFSSPDPYQRRLGHLFKGRLALAYGDFDDAEVSLQRFLEEEDTDGPDNSYGEGLIYLAMCRLGQQRPEDAQALAQRGLQRATTEPFACPLAELQFRRILGIVALAGGDRGEARSLLTRALTLAEEQDNPIQIGFVQLELGRLEWAEENHVAARSRFAEARTAFTSIDNRGALANLEAIVTRLERPESPRDLDPTATPTRVELVTLASATNLVERRDRDGKLDSATLPEKRQA